MMEAIVVAIVLAITITAALVYAKVSVSRSLKTPSLFISNEEMRIRCGKESNTDYDSDFIVPHLANTNI